LIKRLLAGVALAGAASLAALGVAGPASAYTTGPTGGGNTSCHPAADGDGFCTLNLPNIPSTGSYYAAIFVSSDAPFDSAEVIHVQEGESFWTEAASDSFESPDTVRGYSGIFTRGPLAPGVHSVEVSQVSAVNQFLAVAYVFTNSSGFENATAGHTDTTNPSISLTNSQANEWDWCVAHDWTASRTVSTGTSGYADFQHLNDATNGDTMAVYQGSSYTSGSGTSSCGVGTASWSGDDDTIAGIVVKGV